MSSKTSPNPFVGKLWELLANPENWDYIHWNEGPRLSSLVPEAPVFPSTQYFFALAPAF